MFKRYRILLACLFAALIPSAAGANKEPIKSEIEKEYSRFIQFYQKRDVKGIMSFMTPEFTWKHEGKISDIERTEEILNDDMKIIKSFGRIKFDCIKVMPYHDAFVAETKVFFRDIVISEDGKNKHKVSCVDIWRDIWVRTNEGWKIRYSELVSCDPAEGKKPAPAAITPHILD